MTTRPTLAERSSMAARDPERARRLLAGLGVARFALPEAPPALITDEHGDIIDITPLPAPVCEQPAVERYPVRHNAVLVNRYPTRFTPISDADKARLWTTATAMNAKTKTKGSRGGCFGAAGLLVLNRLLFRFANSATGRCDPALATLQTECKHRHGI